MSQIQRKCIILPISGRIDITKLKVPPEKHELETARYFAALGHDIAFIPPSYTPNMHTPDIDMDGVAWEIKCPTGTGKRTIENNFRAAQRQSENIIFDLRKMKVPESKCVAELERRFEQKKCEAHVCHYAERQASRV